MTESVQIIPTNALLKNALAFSPLAKPVQIIPTNALLKNPLVYRTHGCVVQIIPTNALLKNRGHSVRSADGFK